MRPARRRLVARAASCFLLVALVPAGLARASTGRGEDPDTAWAGRIVRRVDVVTRDIFDPVPEGPLAGAYRLANVLHVRTRPITVRAELLVKPGERLRPGALTETARNLRTLDYLVPVRVEASPVNDSVDVLVETRDHWTTSPEVNVEGGGGRLYGTLAFTERNLLGLGTQISMQVRDDPTGVSRSVALSDGNLFGTHLRASVAGGNGAGGKSNSGSFGLPFYALDTRLSFGGAWSRVVSEAQLFDDEAVAARFGRRIEEAEIFWGTGQLAPDGTVNRFLASFEWKDRRLEPSQLVFGAPAEFAGPLEETRLRRLSAELRVWRPRWLQRRGVDRFDRVEDFDVGAQFAFKGGFAPRALGSGADEGYMRARLDAGVDAGPLGFGLARTSWSARLRSGARESLGRVSARWVVQPARDQTFALGAVGEAGRRMPRDFQLELGGLNGLRAFGVHALTGTQAWRLNAEHRVIVLRDCWQLVSFGGAVFLDSGRTWGPGSSGKGWHHGAGFGLRLALPHSALNQVARFDLAWPVGPEDDGRRGPVLTFGSSQAF